MSEGQFPAGDFRSGYRFWHEPCLSYGNMRPKKPYERFIQPFFASDLTEGPEGARFTAESLRAELEASDALISYEYEEARRKRFRLAPEEELMLTILEDAIRCFQDYASARRGRKRRLFLEAEQWFRESDSSWIFSFENICEALGLNPEYIRGGLRRWKQAKASADYSWSDREAGGQNRSAPVRIAQSREDARGEPPQSPAFRRGDPSRGSSFHGCWR